MERDVRTHSYATRPFGRKTGPNREAPLHACGGELVRKNKCYQNTQEEKPVIPDLTLTPPRRVAPCAASRPTRPARFQPSRPRSCDADLDGRRGRAKRPSPQPCPRRRRAECSVATAGLECSSFASKCVASMACWWGRGPFENTRRVPVRRHCNHDRFGRTCTTAASPSQP